MAGHDPAFSVSTHRRGRASRRRFFEHRLSPSWPWRAGRAVASRRPRAPLPRRGDRGGPDEERSRRAPAALPVPWEARRGALRAGGEVGRDEAARLRADLPWTVERRAGASIDLALSSSADTLAVYPWDFAATLQVSLSDAHLRLAFRVKNTGSAVMPFAFGIHPYFAVHDKAGTTIRTAATRAYDNVSHQIVPFRGFALATGETDLHLLDHGEQRERSRGRWTARRRAREPGVPAVGCLDAAREGVRLSRAVDRAAERAQQRGGAPRASAWRRAGAVD